eukprot:scaffold63248_cov20-Tisochrysis_lutea.AAC.2
MIVLAIQSTRLAPRPVKSSDLSGKVHAAQARACTFQPTLLCMACVAEVPASRLCVIVHLPVCLGAWQQAAPAGEPVSIGTCLGASVHEQQAAPAGEHCPHVLAPFLVCLGVLCSMLQLALVNTVLVCLHLFLCAWARVKHAAAG